MKRKILFSPLIIIILIIIFGVGIAGAAIYFGGSGDAGSVNLQKGLMAQWKFDGSAKDATVNSNHGTVTGATLTTDRKGQSNKSYSFDGSNDKVVVSDSPSLTITTAITVSMWINKTAQVDWAGLLWKSDNPFTQPKYVPYSLYIRDAGEALFEQGNGTTTGYVLTPTAISNGTWYHITATNDGTDMIMYVNGVAGTPSSWVGGAFYDPGGYGIDIGHDRRYSDTQRVFNGKIDDVRIYNRALSAAEVMALYESYDPGIVVSDLQKGLISQWKFDGNAKDSTPYGNNGTLTGTTLTTDRKGAANKAYSFNGSSDKVVVSNSSSLDLTTAITVSMWVNKTAQVDWAGLLFKSNTTDNGIKYAQYALYVDSGGSIIFQQGNGTTTSYVQTPTAISNGTWYHITATNDGTNMIMYFNGVAGTPSSWVGGAFYTNNWGMDIGHDRRYSASRFFNGKIDDVRIYNRALSAAEATALYDSYDPGIVISDLQKGLVGNWKFDGNAKDNTPYSNNGTLTGTTLTTDRKGQANKAYSFNGSSDQINTSIVNNSGTNPLTAVVWVKPASFATPKFFIGNLNTSTNKGWVLKTDITTGQFAVVYRGVSDAVESILNSGINLTLNQWAMLTMVRTGSSGAGTMRVFVNGVEGTSGDAGGYSWNTTDPIKIGVDANPGTGDRFFFNGTMDEVRIYNRALSQTEITALYESY